MAVAAAMLLTTTCKDDDEKQKTQTNTGEDTLAVSPTALEFADNATERQTVTVETNVQNWSVAKFDDWITISKGTDNFLVGVQRNYEGYERVGAIIVTAGDADTAIVTVTQRAWASPTALEFAPIDTARKMISVNTPDPNWGLTVDTAAYWLSVEKQENSFTVATARNYYAAPRTGTITVASQHAWPVTITVTQFGADVAPPHDYANDPAMQELKAFPGAEGFGAMVTGGRGGKVVAVTNLLDNAANPPEGSFRWALQQHSGEPITVVFRVSGIIWLENDLTNEINNRSNFAVRLKRDNFTIAGHTAPGEGICIAGNNVNFGGSRNFIIRHLRFRSGAGIYEGAIGIENARNFIIDHCTFGWSAEENMTTYDNDYTTVQWCIVHEGLFRADHAKGDRGYGCQWGGQNATYHHNLLAHNDSRSPRFNGARSNASGTDRNVLIDFVNNVNFNWGRQSSSHGGDITVSGNSHRANFVNNYWKPGPARTNQSYFVQASYGKIPTLVAKWWLNGNIYENNTAWNADNFLGLNMGEYPVEVGNNPALWKATTPFAVPAQYQVAAETAQAAYESVLAGAGAFPRDAVDTRIVSEVRNPNLITFVGASGRTGIIDNPDNVGGYPTYQSLEPPADTDGDGIPDEWELAFGLDPTNPADGAWTTLTGNTYTNFEVYLYDLLRISN